MIRGKNSNNTSGYLGVTRQNGKKKWKAQINFDKKYHYLGLFYTPLEAHLAYLKEAKRLYLQPSEWY